ncbi:hemerythrin domain-containing protein [Mucilaginibacter sp. 14171R-50]|uniref:hemerythrin domain-containing protein n=1 Tax=Mucilaginibacter sp. 14171R-50 TaxID=2703789 RepID=UPI00138D5CE1|nr:hemerythrin domain-containing protein [Mucilaginibacter sp. 14171R-50]QHS56592.1 hemerythrin domain-containing protein [Mucilaginibacter sp. 14171R-50]
MGAGKNKPIRRSEHIVTLSRDHHAGLLFCWKIREGLKKEIPLFKILKYMNFFWEEHLKAHFREEEALLFSRLDDPLSRQGKTEHLMLEERLRHLNHYENKSASEFMSFADLLTRHIRFEERTLFPHLENTLPESVLAPIGKYLAEQHREPFVESYPDEFWSKNYVWS